MKSRILQKDRGEAIKDYNTITDNLSLHYVLYVHKPSIKDREFYSVEITSCFEDDIDSAFAFDISSIRTAAESIFQTLCSGQVTPCTLYDVLEDIL